MENLYYGKGKRGLDMNYNELVINQIIGRHLHPEFMPKVHRGKPMLSFWGEEAGLTGGDIHSSRAYRLYLDYDRELRITDAAFVIEGELISPCSGYTYETLDELDYRAVLNWCLAHTMP